MTKYKLFAIVGPAVALLSILTSIFIAHMSPLYVVSWTIAAVALGLIATEIIWCGLKDELTPQTWQIIIYAIISTIGWMGATLSTSWAICSACVALMVCGLAMLIGTYVLKHLKPKSAEAIQSDAVAEAVEGSDRVKALAESLRYHYVDDDPSKSLNLDKPLCFVDGKTMTVLEADAAGYTEVADAGLEYIKNLF